LVLELKCSGKGLASKEAQRQGLEESIANLQISKNLAYARFFDGL
jgi:hypothetical protein